MGGETGSKIEDVVIDDRGARKGARWKVDDEGMRWDWLVASSLIFSLG
jgi:hypothetical protein